MELIDIDEDRKPSKVFVGRLILPQTEEISDRGGLDTILVASVFLLTRSEYQQSIPYVLDAICQSRNFSKEKQKL